MENKMSIFLDDGIKEYEVNFKSGKKGTISFNPTEPELIQRLDEFKLSFGRRINQIKDFNLTASGLPEDKKMWKQFNEYKKAMMEEIDKAFKSNVADVIFAETSPFAWVKGNFYFVQFFEQIKKIIDEESETMGNEVNEVMKEHIGKY